MDKNFSFSKVLSPSGNPIASVENKKEFFLDLYIVEGGKQRICFSNMDGTSKILAFDFMEAERRRDADLATKGTFLMDLYGVVIRKFG